MCAELARPRKRLTELLWQTASTAAPITDSSTHKRFQLMFLRSPTSFSAGASRVSAVNLAVNTLQGEDLEVIL